MSLRVHAVFGVLLGVVAATTIAFAEEKKDDGKRISPTKAAARVKEKIREGEPDVVARLLTYDEVLEALERAPASARDVAVVVCDKARDIGLKWRGDKPTMRTLTDGLQKMAERAVRAEPKAPEAQVAMSCALGATGRIYESMGSEQPFSTWEKAANFSTAAADLDDANRHLHLLRATRFLREGAPSAEQRELQVLRQALKYVSAARQDRKDDAELRREQAYVHLAMASFAVRMEQEGRAREEYKKALALVDVRKQERPDRKDKGAYNQIVAFAHQHEIIDGDEGFLGIQAPNTLYWDLQFPDARGWSFKLAMENNAVFRVTKQRPDGSRVELVMRRFLPRRKYGVSKAGGDNVGGLAKEMTSFWRQQFQVSDLTNVVKQGLPAFLAKAKGWALVGEKGGERTRIQSFHFRGKENRGTWAVEIHETIRWHKGTDAEASYVLKSLKEKNYKEK